MRHEQRRSRSGKHDRLPLALPGGGGNRQELRRAGRRSEELEIDLAAPGIDRNGDVAAGRIVTDTGGNGLERRDAQRRPAGGERQAAHEGEADADAGECPRAAGGGKAVEILGYGPMPRRGALSPSPPGVRPGRSPSARTYAPAPGPRRCRGERRNTPAATCRGRGPAFRQTGRTSVTSGMKWRSRFSMPCFSVAVDDGQPEHDPPCSGTRRRRDSPGR